MQCSDENQPGDDEASQPRIKPRRIDSPHPALTPHPAPAELPSGIRAAAEPVHGTAGDETPIFHEVPTGDSPRWRTEETTQPALAAEGGETPLEQADDVSLQTEQLAAALQDQLGELDQREAHLTGRTAELERQWQDCQTWHQQQLAALEQREAELSRRQAEMEVFLRRQEEVSERLRDCEAQELALDRRESSLNEREANLVAREHELRDRRQDVERQAAALSRSQQLWEQEKARDEQILDRERRQWQAEADQHLAERHRELEDVQALLNEQAQSLERERQTLHREIAAWQRERQLEDERHASQLQSAEQESQQRLASLAARESALDTQQAALEQLRSEVLSAHRQALEMRLIAEQLWAQLKGLMTPAEITQSLAQLRLKMAEQYELEEKVLAERKEELLALADKLAQQHATLKAQRMEFLAWRKAQQQEIAHQAEHLCRRVQELSEEKKRLRQAA